MTDFYTDTVGIQAQAAPDLFAFAVADSSALARMATLPEPARAVAFVAGPTPEIYIWSAEERGPDRSIFIRPNDRAALPGRWVLAAVGVSGEDGYYDSTSGIQAQADASALAFLAASTTALAQLRTHPSPARSVAYITSGTVFAKDVYVWSESETREVDRDFLRPADRNGARGRWVRVVGGTEEPSSEATPLTIFGADLIEWLDGDLDTDVGGNWVGQVAGSVFTPANAPAYDATGLDGQGFFSYVRPSSQRHSNATLDLPAEHACILVMRNNVWNSGGTIVGSPADTTSGRILQGGSTPELQMNNGLTVNANNGGALASWVLTIAEFTGSISDRLVVGETSVTGASAGTNDPPAGRQIAASLSASHGSCSVAIVVWVTMGVDYATKLAAFIDYINTRYPSVTTL